MRMMDPLVISKLKPIPKDRFSHAMVHFIPGATSDTSKHDEVHDSAIFYLVLHLIYSDLNGIRKLWEAKKAPILYMYS